MIHMAIHRGNDLMNQQIRAYNIRDIMIFVYYFACIVVILIKFECKFELERIKFECKFELEPESAERFVILPLPWPRTLPLQNCHCATLQGRRSKQEDRVTCNTNVKVPLIGRHDVRVGVVAVFDGHNGILASEIASKSLFQKFMLHLNNSMEQSSSLMEQSSDLKEILKSSLVTTINDIDAQYCKFASKLRFKAGSTAVVALIYSNHVLVANVGDSKAFLCSQKIISHEGGAAYLDGLLAKELTRDHNAYRLDEKARVEAFGGVFTFNHNYVPLLMGHFPMTRAIGDLALKRYGVIADPEVTDWLSLTSKDEFLVVASDGIFERLTPQAVCEFLNEVEDHSDPSLLARELIEKAYLEGSNDNLSVVLVPLGSRDLL